MVVVAQLVRAPDCGSGGRRFETGLPPKVKRLRKAGLFFIGEECQQLAYVRSKTIKNTNGMRYLALKAQQKTSGYINSLFNLLFIFEKIGIIDPSMLILI